MEFSILNRKTVYSGRAFDVAIVAIGMPDGNIINYDLVYHPPAVTIIPVDEQKYIHFVCQYRLGAQSELLELPAGVLEKDETPTQCAAREIREETGMAAGELIMLGNFFMAPGYTTEEMHVFLATQLYPAPLAADADEYLSVEKITISNVYQIIHEGKVRDGKSLAALLLAEPYLSRMVDHGTPRSH